MDKIVVLNTPKRGEKVKYTLYYEKNVKGPADVVVSLRRKPTEKEAKEGIKSITFGVTSYPNTNLPSGKGSALYEEPIPPSFEPGKYQLFLSIHGKINDKRVSDEEYEGPWFTVL